MVLVHYNCKKVIISITFSVRFVTYLSVICDDAVQGKKLLEAAINAIFSIPVSGIAEDNSADQPNSNAKPALLWSALYVQELTKVCVILLLCELYSCQNITSTFPYFYWIFSCQYSKSVVPSVCSCCLVFWAICSCREYLSIYFALISCMCSSDTMILAKQLLFILTYVPHQWFIFPDKHFEINFRIHLIPSYQSLCLTGICISMIFWLHQWR